MGQITVNVLWFSEFTCPLTFLNVRGLQAFDFDVIIVNGEFSFKMKAGSRKRVGEKYKGDICAYFLLKLWFEEH